MKKLFILMSVGVLFVSCLNGDKETPLHGDINTAILFAEYFNYPDNDIPYLGGPQENLDFAWPGERAYVTIPLKIRLVGSDITKDKPLKFSLYQVDAGNSAENPGTAGYPGTSYANLNEVYELPVGQKEMTIDIAFLYDPWKLTYELPSTGGPSINNWTDGYNMTFGIRDNMLEINDPEGRDLSGLRTPTTGLPSVRIRGVMPN